MAITKAEILIQVNETTETDESTIETKLLSVLKELSEITGHLKGATATGTIAGDVEYFTAPTDMIPDLIDSLVLGSEDPLRKITWSEYCEDTIEGYCYRDGKIYVRPTPDAAKTYSLEYTRYHVSSYTTIEFPDTEDFREAIFWGVMQKVYEKYERWEDAAQAANRYGHFKGELLSKYSPVIIVKQRTQYRE